MLLYLGWMIAAFLGGFLLARRRRGKRPDMARRLASLSRYRGASYMDILEAAGAPPCWQTRKANGQLVRTWSDGRYSLSLLFDQADVCLGVEDERMLP